MDSYSYKCNYKTVLIDTYPKCHKILDKINRLTTQTYTYIYTSHHFLKYE